MKIRKLTALLLTLCMIFSLSVAAFAAEPEVHAIYDSAPEEAAASAETVTSGTIPGSKIKWELNEHNWLMISGSAIVRRMQQGRSAVGGCAGSDHAGLV